MEEVFKAKLEKYRDKLVAKISILMPYKNKKDILFEDLGIYVFISITFYNIDKKGKISKEPIREVTVSWGDKDFKISKPTFKIIDKIIELGFKNKVSTLGPTGSPFSGLVKTMNRLN
jgi:hypothetical protein